MTSDERRLISLDKRTRCQGCAKLTLPCYMGHESVTIISLFSIYNKFKSIPPKRVGAYKLIITLVATFFSVANWVQLLEFFFVAMVNFALKENSVIKSEEGKKPQQNS